MTILSDEYAFNVQCIVGAVFGDGCWHFWTEDEALWKIDGFCNWNMEHARNYVEHDFERTI